MTSVGSADQPAALERLQRSLSRGRMGHAYLLAGDRLEPLEELARAFAQIVNCAAPEAQADPPTGCGRCPSCREIQAGTHPDIVWIRPESKLRVITVDQVRELMQLVQLKPTAARCKVAVLVAADRLNIQAANAFLKTLEEPPGRSVILLLSTDPERLLETVRSRCLRVNCAAEPGTRLDPARTAWLAALDQAEPAPGLLGRYDLLARLTGELASARTAIEQSLGARSPLDRYEEADARMKERWETELAAAIEAEYRRQRGELLAAFEWWLRDVWLQTVGAAADHLALPHLGEQTARVASALTPEQALDNIQVLDRTQRLLASNVQEALTLEVGLLKLNL